MEGEKITVNIKTPKEKKSVEVEANGSVKDLRAAVSTTFDAATERLCLIYAGKILKDEDTLVDSKVKNGITVHLVIKSATNNQPQQNNSTSNITPNPPQTSTQSNVASNPLGSTPANSQANPFGNLMTSMLNNSGGAGNMQDVQRNMQQRIMQNPEMMRSMLDNPMIQEMMSSPEIMQSIMQSNPEMRQVMEQNPQVGQMLNDPAVMRQTMEIARNPAMMQEMMRNYDRALSNIESIPGGMNHLQRMYTDVQEPLMNATTFGANPFASLVSNQPTSESNRTETTDPLPNPWNGGSAAAGSNSQPNRPSVTNNSTNVNGSNTSAAAPTNTNIGGAGGNNSWMESIMRQMSANPELMRNAMQAPYVQASMQAMQQDPAMLEQMLQNNPMFNNNPAARDQLRQMLPQLMTQMQNPSFQASMTNPRALEAMMQIQQGINQLREVAPDMLSSVGGGLGGLATTGVNSNVSATATNNTTNPTNVSNNSTNSQSQQQAPNTAQLADLFSRMASVHGNTQAAQQPPETRFSSQLEQLAQMGFTNRQINIQALTETFGDVNSAIERILQRQ